MSLPFAAIHPMYLRVRRANIAFVKFLFESYEGVGIVRTVDRREAIIVVLVIHDFLQTAREILRAVQAEIECVEVDAPPTDQDDWLMREIGKDPECK